MQNNMDNPFLWRASVKKFDPSLRVTDEDFLYILDTARFAPSSFGLQPWRFVVVQNPALRQQLRPAAWNQSQVTDASHLIVCCGVNAIDANYVRNFMTATANGRGVPLSSLVMYENMILGFLQRLSPDGVKSWIKQQVYIALGFMMTECAHRRIDSCPMEGFDPEKFDEILGLPAKGVSSIVNLAVGYRAADDVYPNYPKIRFNREEIVEWR